MVPSVAIDPTADNSLNVQRATGVRGVYCIRATLFRQSILAPYSKYVIVSIAQNVAATSLAVANTWQPRAY